MNAPVLRLLAFALDYVVVAAYDAGRGDGLPATDEEPHAVSAMSVRPTAITSF